MSIGRLGVIAIGLFSFAILSACEPYRRARECRGISDLVNPTLKTIDAARKTQDDAPAYARIAVLYDDLSVKLLARKYSTKRLGDAVTEYAKLLAEASRNARAFSDALVANDPGRGALVRAAGGHIVKRESAALLRIDAACVSR
jgi:hypothetical protein